MNWTPLSSENLSQIISGDYPKTAVIFKHSTRCPVSMMAKRHFERGWIHSEEEITPFYLDLISFRDLSNEIAEAFSVEHQSPQMLVIKEGKCVFHTSHSDIDADKALV
ncbi:MAG: bacillithiol system protein YtxJ [Sphingobacteriales bacterium]|jgi:bacillithiol system protein YtxJ